MTLVAMRIVAVLLSLMFLALPLAAAQSSGPGSDGCRDDVCRDQEDAPDDAPRDAARKNSTDERDAEARNETARERAAAYCEDHPDDRRCQSAEERFEDDAREARRDARHITFELDRVNRTLSNYTIAGKLAFDAIIFTDDGEAELDREGNMVRLRTNESVLKLHDTIRGNIEYKSKVAPLVLDLPAGAFLGRHGETERGHFLVIEYDTAVGKLASDRIVMEGDQLTIYGFAAFHLQVKEDKPPASAGKQQVDLALERAEEERHLGAKVAIRKVLASEIAARDGPITEDASGGALPASAPRHGASDKVSDVEVTEYDDMEITVDAPDKLVGDSILEVQVSAELDAGRTVVLDLDPELLNGLSATASSALALRYYDLNDDGTRTEVVFGMAEGGLNDILNPTDDAGQPEYWIVEDADGIQVLVSFPHWSTHIVTLQNIAEYLTQPSVVIGIMAGVGGVAVAAVAMFMPRRRQDDLY